MGGDGGGEGGACAGVGLPGLHARASKKERHFWKKPSSLRNVQGKDLKAGALTIQKENMDSKTVAPHAIGVCSMVDVVWYGWYSS